MRIAAYDVSTRLGWGVFRHREDPDPLFGTFKLPKTLDPSDIAGRTLPLRIWLRQHIGLHRPDAVAFESPWLPLERDKSGPSGFVTNGQVVRLLVSLAGELETTAKECGVARIIEVATATAKIALTGTSRLGPDRKKLMVIAATRRGWKVSDDNQADAGAVGLAAYDHFMGPE